MAQRASLACKYHPNAELIEDSRAGDMICPDCGCVVGDRVVDVSQEWRTFSDSNNDPSRVGASENPLLNSDLSTMIGSISGPAGLDEQGNPRYRNRQMMSSENRALHAAFNYIDETGSKGRLPRSITEQAKQIYKQTHDMDKEKMTYRHRQPVAAAALFLACRDEKTARSYKEMSAFSGVSIKRLTKSINYIERTIGKRGGAQTSSEFFDSFMPRVCSQLGLPSEISRIALHIATKSNESGVTLGRSYVSVAAAAIYLAVIAMDLKKPIKDICENAGCADTTLKQAYRVMVANRQALASLFPPDFKLNVPVEQLPQL